MSSNRHYNVRRHIQRRHGGMGEPVRHETTQYYTDMNPQNFRFPFAYSHHVPSSSLRKERSDKKFSDVLEDQILPPLRKMVEYKNLLSQLQPTFPPPSSSGSANVAYQDLSISNFRDMYFINSISNLFEKPFPPDSWITIGLKGRVCGNCFNKIYIPIFFKFEGKYEIFEPQHECDEIGLLYSAEEREGVLNSSNVNFTEQMIKLIKIWMQGKDCVIVAREIGEQAAVIGDINADQNDHWSARAIRDKLTTLKDDNELTDFLAKTNNSTFGFFKIYSSQQQSSARFYLFMIVKKEWL
jgi:hypothetical protein